MMKDFIHQNVIHMVQMMNKLDKWKLVIIQLKE